MSLSLNRVNQTDSAFIKTYGAKTPIWKYYSRCALDFIGVRQPVEYYNKRKRLEFEYQTLKLWISYDLNVPEIIRKNSFNLHLSIIKGRTLHKIFTESNDIDMDLVIKLINDLNYRHHLAFKNNEPKLCHVDANLRNIVYSNNKIFHIDFEMGREYENIGMWAQREISKLLISLLNNIPVSERDNVVRLFCNIYEHNSVINSLIKSKLRKIKLNRHKDSGSSNYALVSLARDLQIQKKINEN